MVQTSKKINHASETVPQSTMLCLIGPGAPDFFAKLSDAPGSSPARAVKKKIAGVPVCAIRNVLDGLPKDLFSPFCNDNKDAPKLLIVADDTDSMLENDCSLMKQYQEWAKFCGDYPVAMIYTKPTTSAAHDAFCKACQANGINGVECYGDKRPAVVKDLEEIFTKPIARVEPHPATMPAQKVSKLSLFKLRKSIPRIKKPRFGKLSKLFLAASIPPLFLVLAAKYTLEKYSANEENSLKAREKAQEEASAPQEVIEYDVDTVQEVDSTTPTFRS